MNCDLYSNQPIPEYFEELFRISKNQIIWGGNYFDLKPTRCIICWDKVQPWENFSQWEMAWTSFDKPAALFKLSNNGVNNSEIKIHPTQKPIMLYSWLINKYAKQNDKIFDSHIGSGSSRIDEEYFNNQEMRFKKECHNEDILKNGKTIKQLSLF